MKFLNELSKTKIPSLILLTVLFYFGAGLIKDEDTITVSVVAGGVILIVALVLAVFSFADYRHREEVDDVIRHLKTALEHVSGTHTMIEKNQQKYLGRKAGTESQPSVSYTTEGDNTMSG